MKRAENLFGTLHYNARKQMQKYNNKTLQTICESNTNNLILKREDNASDTGKEQARQTKDINPAYPLNTGRIDKIKCLYMHKPICTFKMH